MVDNRIVDREIWNVWTSVLTRRRK